MQPRLIPVSAARFQRAGAGAPERRGWVDTSAALVGGYALVLLLATLWRYEEPNKLATILAALTVYSLGALLIKTATTSRLISHAQPWLLAFTAKLTLTFCLTSAFWAAPLSPDRLRMRDQTQALQDSNTYDYDGATLAEGGFSTDAQVSGTWLSWGLVRYIAVIYTVFGVSVLYVSWFNCVLSLIGFLSLVAALGVMDQTRRARWQILCIGMLSPFASYYDATPSKEPLTNALLCLSLLAAVLLSERRARRYLRAIFLLVAISLLSVVRLNVALLVLIASALVVSKHRRSVAYTVAIVTIGAIGIVGLSSLTGQTSAIAGIIGSTGKLDSGQHMIADREAVGDHGLKLAVGRVLTPSSIPELVALAPARLLVWLYLPYPFVLPSVRDLAKLPELVSLDPRGYVYTTANLMGQLGCIVFIVLTPFVIDAFRDRKDRIKVLRPVVIYLLVTAVPIGSLNLVMGRRYRILIEPLVFAVALCSRPSPRRRALAIGAYCLFSAGVVVAAIFSS